MSSSNDPNPYASAECASTAAKCSEWVDGPATLNIRQSLYRYPLPLMEVFCFLFIKSPPFKANFTFRFDGADGALRVSSCVCCCSFKTSTPRIPVQIPVATTSTLPPNIPKEGSVFRLGCYCARVATRSQHIKWSHRVSTQASGAILCRQLICFLLSWFVHRGGELLWPLSLSFDLAS